MTNKERLEDLLIEFDEFGMQPTIIVPDPVDRAEAWKHELTYAIKHLKAEVASEVIDEFAERLKERLVAIPTVYNSHFGRVIDDIAKEMKGGAE